MTGHQAVSLHRDCVLVFDDAVGLKQYLYLNRRPNLFDMIIYVPTSRLNRVNDNVKIIKSVRKNIYSMC